MPADTWDELEPDKQAIRQLILKHKAEVNRLKKLKAYYEGQHDILNSSRSNKLVCNHAKDITDTATSYFLGNPIAYKSKEDISVLTDALTNADADEADGDNSFDLSIHGRAYEYIYTKQGETELAIKNLEPESTFIVYDDTIEQRELFAVYYDTKVDATDNRSTIYIATILTQNYKYVLNILDTDGNQMRTEEPEAHFKGEVPVIMYLNNKLGLGDYELQIPLIDAYNALMSDRVTDKEQFIDSILALYGALLSDEDDTTEPMTSLKKNKLLELPADARAEYLTRTFDENGVEILKRAIEQDIYKFSHIPCLTDEAFGGNISGVAMEFKLLGLENITKIKTRYYKKGLRKRLRIFSHFLGKTKGTIDVTDVTPVFSRALPRNLLEISQYILNLWGKVSKKTLLAQIPFIDDLEEEVKEVERENLESLLQDMKRFGLNSNTPPEGDDDEP